MMTVLVGFVFVIAVVLALPAVGLVLLILAALWPKRLARPPIIPESMRLAILVPAHNESVSVIPTIKNLLPQITAQDQLIVIADNCTDDTAALALAEGATVIERTDLERRGKGYALAHGVDFLRKSPPDVVMVVDADCQVQGAGVRSIAALAMLSGRPVQMLDLMLAVPQSSIRTRVMAFAWLLKNLVRPSGMQFFGDAVHLNGTGMAFPWGLMSCANLASGHIAEDMKLGVDLTLAGLPPLFDTTARVISYFPENADVGRVQKSRWEHGHLQTIREELPRLLRSWLQHPTRAKWVLAMDLSIPPTALYVMLLTAGLVVYAVLAWLVPEMSCAFELLFSALSALAVSILLAWWQFGRATISLRDLLTVPAYLFWKLPVYLAYAARKRVGWIRTARD